VFEMTKEILGQYICPRLSSLTSRVFYLNQEKERESAYKGIETSVLLSHWMEATEMTVETLGQGTRPCSSSLTLRFSTEFREKKTNPHKGR